MNGLASRHHSVSQHAWRIGLLTLVIIALLVALHQMGDERVSLAQVLRARSQSARLWWASLKDPSFHTVVSPLRLKDLDGKEVTVPLSEKPTALLFMSKCAGCNAPMLLYRWSEMSRRHPQASCFVVTPDSANAEGVTTNQRAMILVDHQRRAAKALNVYFQPRVFVLSKEGRLAFIQNHSMTTEATLDAAEKQLKSFLHATER
jgi:hypothetical protein